MAPTSFKMPPASPPADDDDLPKPLTPSAWPRPIGYANGMIAKGRVIVTAGLVGWDWMGNFPEGFVAQARQLFTNMLAILGEGGAGPEHLVRLTWYVIDLDESRAGQQELAGAARGPKGRVAAHTQRGVETAGSGSPSLPPPLMGRNGAKLIVPFRPALAA